MNADKLAKVYLDNQPLDLVEAQPQVSAILFASGKPKSTSVQWLTARSDSKGKAMLPEDVVDRTAEPATPIYLTSVDAGSFGRKADAPDASEIGAAPVPGRASTQDQDLAKPEEQHERIRQFPARDASGPAKSTPAGAGRRGDAPPEAPEPRKKPAREEAGRPRADAPRDQDN